MAIDTDELAATIYEQALKLPPESLSDLAKYVEFLRFKAQSEQETQQQVNNLRIVNLRGLLKGYDVSPASLAAARREMWRKLESPAP